MSFRSCLLALLLLPIVLRAEPENYWQKLKGCTLIDSRWRDGDSFHAKHDGTEYIFRLYFMDTPERGCMNRHSSDQSPSSRAKSTAFCDFWFAGSTQILATHSL